MFDLLTKEGESTPDDEEKSTVGVNPDQQPDPEDREDTKGTLDAPWGEQGKKQPAQFSDAVAQAFVQSRQHILDELFDTKGPAAKAEQELVRQNLEHGDPGEYETSAPLLEEKTSSDRTLREQLDALPLLLY